MITKGDKTKSRIIETTAELFAEKGYNTVTMKDICERCDLSRGGLYRHFDSTKDIFLAILNDDKDEARLSLEESIKNEITPENLLNHFIKQQKNTIGVKASGLALAIHEFAFSEPNQKDFMNQRYETAVEILRTLLEYGQRKKVFAESDTQILASHIVVFLEGLRTSSAVLTMTEEHIDSQLNFIKEMIIHG